jgi:hypothetical protein
MYKNNIKSKKVLLLMPNFFNYPKLLIEELESRGALVHFVENKQLPFDFASPKCQFRFFRKIVYSVFGVRWNYIKTKIDLNVKYDFFICINGFSFDKKIVAQLKEINPEVRCVLYLWDSVNMFEWKGIIQYFDKSFTFDPLDAERLNINYLANFYPKNIHVSEKSPIYDLFFIGTQHADRFDVLKKIVETSDTVSSENIRLLVKYRNVFHNKILYKLLNNMSNSFAKNYVKNFQLIERKIKADFLIYDPLDSEKALKMMNQSRCVLDIQAPSQVGLPHQLIQALAMGKKIITVNKWVCNFDFYNSDQILIINRDNPVISQKFLKTDLKLTKIDESIKRSRIDNWVDIILS